MNWNLILSIYLFIDLIVLLITGFGALFADVEFDDWWDWIAYSIAWPFLLLKAVFKQIKKH